MDLLISDFLVDVRGEQPCREPRVLGLLDDEPRRGLDGELVELARARAIVEAADRLGGKARARAIHGAHNLVHVDRLARAVALGDSHRALRMARVRAILLWPAIRTSSALSTLDRLAQHAPFLRALGKRVEGMGSPGTRIVRTRLLGPTAPPRGFRVRPAAFGRPGAGRSSDLRARRPPADSY
jgi:hypothetical protein